MPIDPCFFSLYNQCMTYYFETYGCEMNIAESASMKQLLIARGGKPDMFPQKIPLQFEYMNYNFKCTFHKKENY